MNSQKIGNGGRVTLIMHIHESENYFVAINNKYPLSRWFNDSMIQCFNASMLEFEYVPTPLASGGVGMFIDETLHYKVIEMVSIEMVSSL